MIPERTDKDTLEQQRMRKPESATHAPPAAGWLKRVASEPLVHFLVLGAALFMLYTGFSGQSAVTNPRHIVVDELQLQRLAQEFQRTWMRPPTRQELDGLVAGFVDEEILYREALALGLDQDDLVIRRRLRQKMEFLNADLTEPPAASDADLQAYLDAHRDAFREPERFSFSQVFLKSGDSGGDARKRAASLLEELQAHPPAAADVTALGDPTLLPDGMQRATADDISRAFGREFADSLVAAPVGEWSGPYASGYGLHLVYIAQHSPASGVVLADVRQAVEREWSAEQRRVANERFYQAMRDRYSIEILFPEPRSGEAVAATVR